MEGRSGSKITNIINIFLWSRIKFLETNEGWRHADLSQLVFWSSAFLVNVIYSEQGAGKGGGFAEGYKEGFVDLALGVNEDATKEKNEASDGEDKG